MTLEEFIALKPPELRLGQFFWNVFFRHQHPESSHMKESSTLYQVLHEDDSVRFIKFYMRCYQWQTLDDALVEKFFESVGEK